MLTKKYIQCDALKNAKHMGISETIRGTKSVKWDEMCQI